MSDMLQLVEFLLWTSLWRVIDKLKHIGHFELMKIIGTLIVLLLCANVFVAIGQETLSAPRQWNNGIGHSAWEIGLKSEDKSKLLDLWNSIGEDLKHEQNPLAGTYVKLDNSGYFLRWSIKKGFVVIPYFDQNLITDYGYGSVTFVDPSEIIFKPERQLRGGRGLDKMPDRWTAIWRYLVPVESLKEFGQFVSGRGKFNEFDGLCCEFLPTFMTHRIDGPNDPPSYPVPARYEQFILKPIEGQITYVGKPFRKNLGFSGQFSSTAPQEAILIPVRLNVGRLQGVKKNMYFRVPSDPESGQFLQIVKTARQTSDAYVIHFLSEDRKETWWDFEAKKEKPYPAIRKGEMVTTRPLQVSR